MTGAGPDGPDPSILTTAQLDRATKALSETINARMDSLEQDVARGSSRVDHIPEEIVTQVGHLKDLHAERFGSVAKQFAERDIRGEQASKASSEALAAALQAAKELVGVQGEAAAAVGVKSEASFTKQMDQVTVIISTLEKALDSRITELKERIDRGEGGARAVHGSREDQRAGVAQLVAVISTFLMFASIVAAVIIAVRQ